MKRDGQNKGLMVCSWIDERMGKEENRSQDLPSVEANTE